MSGDAALSVSFSLSLRQLTGADSPTPRGSKPTRSKCCSRLPDTWARGPTASSSPEPPGPPGLTRSEPMLVLACRRRGSERLRRGSAAGWVRVGLVSGTLMWRSWKLQILPRSAVVGGRSRWSLRPSAAVEFQAVLGGATVGVEPADQGTARGRRGELRPRARERRGRRRDRHGDRHPGAPRACCRRGRGVQRHSRPSGRGPAPAPRPYQPQHRS